MSAIPCKMMLKFADTLHDDLSMAITALEQRMVMTYLQYVTGKHITWYFVGCLNLAIV